MLVVTTGQGVDMTEEKKKTGRPSTCTAEVISKAQQYVDGGWEKDANHNFPSAVGLAKYLKVNRRILYSWGEKNEIFQHILDDLQNEQEFVLLDKALVGDYNTTIAKLVLGKHGYHEKTESEHSGAGGGPLQIQEIKRVVIYPDSRD